MAIGPQSWRVLPHSPIEALAPNLWRVEGAVGASNKRVMVLVRLGDGRIIVHNAIALDEPNMKRIDEWGTVDSILIPNRFHRLDAHIMHQRYPKAKAYAPRGALAAASKATPCAGTYADVPVDSTVTLREVEGMGDREGVLLVKSDDGVSAVYCDTVLNLPKLSGFMGFMLHPTGTLSVPRGMRYFLAKDKKVLRADLERIAEGEGLRRVIPGHGAAVTSDAPARLREAAARLS